jgi:hypothetical protein
MEHDSGNHTTITSEVTLTEEAYQHLAQLVEAYINIGDQLASDSISNMDAYSGQLKAHLTELVEIQIPDHTRFWEDPAMAIESIQEKIEMIEHAENWARHESLTDTSVMHWTALYIKQA